MLRFVNKLNLWNWGRSGILDILLTNILFDTDDSSSRCRNRIGRFVQECSVFEWDKYYPKNMQSYINVVILYSGKEGRQASLAADFSITQFSFIAPLLLVHGRYSYKRSASLAQFVMHRGLIITGIESLLFSFGLGHEFLLKLYVCNLQWCKPYSHQFSISPRLRCIKDFFWLGTH